MSSASRAALPTAGRHRRLFGVQGVHAESVDVDPEMRVLVEPGLLGWPVETPLARCAGRCAAQSRSCHSPAGAIDLVGPAGAAEPVAKVVEDGGLDVDLERLEVMAETFPFSSDAR